MIIFQEPVCADTELEKRFSFAETKRKDSNVYDQVVLQNLERAFDSRKRDAEDKAFEQEARARTT